MEIIDNIRQHIGRIVITSILAAIMVVGLAACGTDTSSSTTTDATAATSVPSDQSIAATDTPVDMSTMGATAEPTSVTSDAATPTAQSAVPSDAGITQINATLKEWAIELSQSEVPAGKVQFTVTNTGRMEHNFTVTDSSGVIGQTPNFVASDGPQTLEVDLKPGTYTIMCSLPGHAARGQITQLVVK